MLMYVLLAVAFSLTGILISFLRVASRPAVTKTVTNIVFWLAIAVTIANAVVFFAGLKAGALKSLVAGIYNWGKAVWFLFAVLLASVLVKNEGDIYPLKKGVMAASILCAGFFFMVTIGKLRHLEEMKTFFLLSGYPVSFLYLNMIVECMAAVGLLLHFYARSGFISSVILLLMMLAAVFTHVKNGDALADSYDAFMQLLLLLLLMALYVLEDKRRKKIS